MRRALQLLAVMGAIVISAASFFHPYGDLKGHTSRALPANPAVANASVAAIVARSCANCHSESTRWPWYSYVAPMSWMIEGDVSQARQSMNLSQWDHYSDDEKQVYLSAIAVMVKSRTMPPARYLALHPEAKLSDAEIAGIYQWARNEKQRLKTVASLKLKVTGPID